MREDIRSSRARLRALRIIIYASCLSAVTCAAGPVSPEETGIKGQVLLGPASAGPQQEGRAGGVPFSAKFFVQDEDENPVAEFESDEKGRFRVVLAPGDYTIVPDKSAPMLFPTRQKRDVTVPEDGFADITLRFDTGLR